MPVILIATTTGVSVSHEEAPYEPRADFKVDS